MINFGDVTKGNIKKNHPVACKFLIIHTIEGSGCGKTNSLFMLICHQSDIHKIYLYAKHPFEAKYQLLINKQESIGLKHLNDCKAFIEYQDDMDEFYKNIEEYNPNKKLKILIIFDDMTADMLSNRKLNHIVTELSIRGRKLNISLAFIRQSCFSVPKNIRINSTHCFIIKIPNKQ